MKVLSILYVFELVSQKKKKNECVLKKNKAKKKEGPVFYKGHKCACPSQQAVAFFTNAHAYMKGVWDFATCAV